jgi:hypothetical protein
VDGNGGPTRPHLFLVAFGALLSRSFFPLGKLLLQIFVAVLWFCIGAAALHIWAH